MKKFVYAFGAVALCAAPAAARDGSAYVGIEAGLLSAGDLEVDRVRFTDVTGSTLSEFTYSLDGISEVELGAGYDADLIAGYDFGMFRIEAELAHKRADAKDFDPPALITDDIEQDFALDDDDLDWDGGARVTSLMANALLDIGSGDGLSAFVGAGYGRARIKLFGDKDSSAAWQLLAGVRTPVSSNIDVGLKYRYFRTGRVDFTAEDQDTGGRFTVDADGRFRSHSLLASLVFNFGARAADVPPPAPAIVPPPPVAAPATQTCPDGTVIMASDICPPPPPPPPAAGERG